MKHVTEEDLTLHHYDRQAAVAEHLAECGDCARQYEELSSALKQVSALQVPERPADYGERVWQTIRPRLTEDRPRRQWWRMPRSWALAGAMAAIAVVAFVAGRVTQAPSPDQISPAVAEEQRERVLQVALSEHLDRTQRMLLEMKHAPLDAADPAGREQRVARELADANRLYRQTARQIGDEALASTLEELERFLINVAHAEGEDQEKQNLRTESEDLLFKIRIIRSNLDRELATPQRQVLEAATPRVTI